MHMPTAAELIRDARSRAALTQSALAKLSGIPQNVISDYERGKREPSFRIVDILLAAAGVTIELSRRTTLDRVRAHAREIHRTLDDHGATNPTVFGSVAREEDGIDSDIDLLIDATPGTTLFDLLGLQAELEQILARPVDLALRSGLRPDVAEAARLDGIPL